MPVSAYVQSAIFLILAAVALFAAAGTLAILGFWLYLAILAAIIVPRFWRSIPACCASACVRADIGRPWRCAYSPLSCFCIGSWRGSTAAAFIGAMAFRHG